MLYRHYYLPNQFKYIPLYLSKMSYFLNEQSYPVESQQNAEEAINFEVSMDFNSLYIPNLPEDLMLQGRPVYTEADWTHFFETQFPLGKVKRVDIATRPHRGPRARCAFVAVEPDYSDSHIRCAFVHFEEWNYNSYNFRQRLASGEAVRLYGTSYAGFYSASNRSFTRFINIKINKTPIAEVPALEAEKMNIHQLVDNYHRIEKQLSEKDARIADLERQLSLEYTHSAKLNERNEYLVKLAECRLQMIQDMEFELVSSRCELGDIGELNDGRPMSMEDLCLGVENV